MHTIIIQNIQVTGAHASDFPTGDTFEPYDQSQVKANRDMLIVMKSPEIVAVYSELFSEDWNSGFPWTHIYI